MISGIVISVLGIVGLVALIYFAQRMTQAIEGIEPNVITVSGVDLSPLAEAIAGLPSRIIVEPSIQVTTGEIILPEASPPTIQVDVQPSEVIIREQSQSAPQINVQVEPTPFSINVPTQEPPEIIVNLSASEGAVVEDKNIEERVKMIDRMEKAAIERQKRNQGEM